MAKTAVDRDGAAERAEIRRQAFGAALAQARRVRDVSQTQLAEDLGDFRQSTVSAWESGENIPEAEIVFAVEQYLDLPPGHLSRHLGYMPPAGKGQAPALTFEDVVMADPLLDEPNKRSIVAMYRELTKSSGRRRR